MAFKKPIALYSGKLKELQAGDILSSISTGSYSTMQAISSPSDGMQFYCTDYLPGLWIYHSFGSEWKYQASPQDLLFSQNFTISPGGSASFSNFAKLTSGSGAATTITSDTSGLTKYGVYLAMITGTTTTGSASILNAAGHLMYSSSTKKAAFFFRFKISNLSTVTDEYYVNLGNADTSNGISTVALVYNRLNTSNPNWYAVCGTTYSPQNHTLTTATAADTGIAVDTNYHEAVILFDAASSCRFYIDGTLVATITTNLPTTTRLFGGVHIKKTAGTTSRELQVDYLTGYLYKK